jgi:hypothetical protein
MCESDGLCVARHSVWGILREVRSTNPRTWLAYSVVVVIVGVVLGVTSGWAGIILIVGGLLVGVRSAREMRR